MTQMTVDIPETLASLSEPERNLLIRAGLYEATRARIRHLKAEIAESEAHIRHYEAQYQVSLAQFETDLLPTLDTLQAHEDYNDWFFWQTVLTEKQGVLAELQHVESD